MTTAALKMKNKGGKGKSTSSSPKSVVAEIPVKKAKKVSVVREVEEVEADSSDEEFFSEAEEGSEVEDDGGVEDAEEEGSDLEDNDNNENSEEGSKVPNPNKKSKVESRQEAKKMKLERQANRPHNEPVQEAKRLWERVRRRDQPTVERAPHLAALFKILSGKFKDVIVKHDASRMVQTCIKYGSPEQRIQIANELKGAYGAIAKSRYGKHIVKKLLQYCPSVRKSIISEFRGQVGKLIRQVDASMVLEEVYSEYANGRDRNALLLEFYGPEFVLFQKRSGDEAIPSLGEILKDSNEEKRAKVLKYLREALDALINKGSLQHTLIHRMMLEYVQYEEVAKIQDWISVVEGQLVEIVHTFEGARVVAKCLTVATAKQRKNILKSFKPYVSKIAKEEYAHQVLLVAFAVVDDTVLMRSTILSEILKDLTSFLQDKHAVRLILYLLSTASGSTASILSSQAMKMVKEAEATAVAAGTSKKDANVRSQELRADLIEPLSDLICDVGILSSSPLSLENLVEDVENHDILLESALSLHAVWTKLLSGPMSQLDSYESADFRALMKKWARKCCESQGKEYLCAVKDILPNLIQSEAAYIFTVLISTKPTLKAHIPQIKTDNEHAQALYQRI